MREVSLDGVDQPFIARLGALVEGRCDTVTVRGGREVAGEVPPLLFPGAFNPLHTGHRTMSRLAAGWLDKEVAFEISLTNVDKPMLSTEDVVRRVRQFSRQELVLLTRSATFVEKSRLFENPTFLVGADTVLRIGDPNYYRDANARDATLEELAERGCRFLVFGRLASGEFVTLEQLSLPRALHELCVGVGERDFRVDVSSSDLRRRFAS